MEKVYYLPVKFADHDGMYPYYTHVLKITWKIFLEGIVLDDEQTFTKLYEKRKGVECILVDNYEWVSNSGCHKLSVSLPVTLYFGKYNLYVYRPVVRYEYRRSRFKTVSDMIGHYLSLNPEDLRKVIREEAVYWIAWKVEKGWYRFILAKPVPLWSAMLSEEEFTMLKMLSF